MFRVFSVHKNYLAGWDGCGSLHVKSNGRWKVLAILKNKQTKITETIPNTKTNFGEQKRKNVFIQFVCDLPA